MRGILLKVYNSIYTAINRIVRIVFLRLPIRKNVILFSSLGGQYSDSPKAISEYIHTVDPNIRIYWAISNVQTPNYVHDVRFGSITHTMISCTAQAVVDNFYCGGKMVYKGFPQKVYARDNQYLFTTWHGSAFKKSGRDTPSGNSIVDFVCGNLTMFNGNEYSLKIMNHLTFGKINMILTGMPRNDCLINTCNNIHDIKNSLGLPIDKRIALYAPTFRSDDGEDKHNNIQRSGLLQLSDLDIEAFLTALSYKFGGEWVLACRLHHYVRKDIDFKKYNGLIIDANTNQDMAPYLQCSDILISDASSCMFDFVLTKKPIFMYFPDFDNYLSTERGGFYYPCEKLPFTIAKRGEELVTNIASFDDNEYQKKVEYFIKEFGFYEDGHATERCGKIILERIGNK